MAIIAEGYTAEEEAKFQADLDRFAGVFFKLEPYKSHRDKFNITGVFKPSAESGCDEPSHGSFKSTALGATFDSLGSERYLLTEDNKSLRDIAAHVPYDALYIMVNHKRYGGGGIYNLYCTFTTDNQWYEYLFLHEFGHSFAGLADEYYTSQVAYNEFYPGRRRAGRGEHHRPARSGQAQVEGPRSSPGVGIPTLWEKAEFDEMDNAYQKIRAEVNEKIARMKTGRGGRGRRRPRRGGVRAPVARARRQGRRVPAGQQVLGQGRRLRRGRLCGQRALPARARLPDVHQGHEAVLQGLRGRRPADDPLLHRLTPADGPDGRARCLAAAAARSSSPHVLRIRYFLYQAPGPGFEVRAVVSKRGVDDGNQKGGGFLQPAQESHISL